MKFNVLKVILWLKSGNIRELNFEPDKINLITGNPGTGKTDIFHIIYYCLFYDDIEISDSIINENVNWYGIQLQINNCTYTICRKSKENGQASNDFFFSAIGEIPPLPEVNNTKNDIKSIIETEFSISKNTNIPFGGNFISAGSKISINYLLMLNAIDVSIIENPNIYVAFQNEVRNKEALDRIFDLVLGIETVENIITREEYNKIVDDISRLERKQDKISSKKLMFQEELQDIVNKIKSYGLIPVNDELPESISKIESLLDNLNSNQVYIEPSERSDLESQLVSVQYKLRNLLSFQDEFIKYQNTKKKDLESLKPIEYLKEKDNELVKTSIYDEILNVYTNQLSEIKHITREQNPISNQIRNEQIKLENKKKELETALNNLPNEEITFDSNKEKLYYLGQIKSKFDLYHSPEISENYQSQIDKLKEKLDTIKILDISSQRDIARAYAENCIKEYMKSIGNSLGNYKDYIPCFNMKKENLQLINPVNNRIESVGSSSNHMFMQLLFSLGLQQLAFVNQSKFLAPFLIIDQPSRPYYGKNNEKVDIDSSDESKIKNAFKLLNEFVDKRKRDKGSFQMIILEHIPKDYVSNLENVYIVEEFLNGNALIPHSEYNNPLN